MNVIARPTPTGPVVYPYSDRNSLAETLAVQSIDTA